MRYLTSLGLCLLALTVLGCNNQTQPLATPPAEEKASSGEAVPAVHNATQTGKEHESREANENGGFGLDVDVGDVATDSDTETYAALKLFLDNWRWHDVPFYLRTGKRIRGLDPLPRGTAPRLSDRSGRSVNRPRWPKLAPTDSVAELRLNGWNDVDG